MTITVCVLQQTLDDYEYTKLEKKKKRRENPVGREEFS